MPFEHSHRKHNAVFADLKKIPILVLLLATKKATRQKKTPAGETVAKAQRDASKTSQIIAIVRPEGEQRRRS